MNFGKALRNILNRSKNEINSQATLSEKQVKDIYDAFIEALNTDKVTALLYILIYFDHINLYLERSNGNLTQMELLLLQLSEKFNNQELVNQTLSERQRSPNSVNIITSHLSKILLEIENGKVNSDYNNLVKAILLVARVELNPSDYQIELYEISALKETIVKDARSSMRRDFSGLVGILSEIESNYIQ